MWVVVGPDELAPRDRGRNRSYLSREVGAWRLKLDAMAVPLEG